MKRRGVIFFFTSILKMDFVKFYTGYSKRSKFRCLFYGKIKEITVLDNANRVCKVLHNGNTFRIQLTNKKACHSYNFNYTYPKTCRKFINMLHSEIFTVLYIDIGEPNWKESIL
jgi:hypothetical protein